MKWNIAKLGWKRQRFGHVSIWIFFSPPWSADSYYRILQERYENLRNQKLGCHFEADGAEICGIRDRGWLSQCGVQGYPTAYR